MINKDIITFLKSKEVSNMFDTYGITKAYIFGSYARGENTNYSDLDIMIENNRKLYPLTLFDYVDIENFFKDKIGVSKVDIGTKKSINKHIMQYVKKDLLQIK